MLLVPLLPSRRRICPPLGTDPTPDPSTGTPYGRWTAVFSCSVVGIINGEFCCDYSNSESCCPSNFTQFVTGEAFKPGADARQVAIASSAIASAMAASGTETCAPAETSSGGHLAASDCPKGNGDLGTKVGLGVGIPLGVLVLAILGFLGWREWRKYHANTGAYSSASGAISRESGGGLVGAGFHKPELDQGQEYRPRFNPASEMSPRPQYSEFHAPVTYFEADGRPGRQEMPS